jgi:protein-tyrosine phosphatase
MYDPFLPDHCIVDRYPIVDVSIPTEKFMVTILNAIDQYLSESRVPYVHCWGGIGRTGTVVGCWLIRHGHVTSDTVGDLIGELRVGDIEAGYRLSPEAESQWEFVLNWKLGK